MTSTSATNELSTSRKSLFAKLGYLAGRFASRTLRPIPYDEVDWSKDLFVYHHLGLGDMIHCNGMVRYFLSKLDRSCVVRVFCKERNLSMVSWMYRDEPRIVLEIIPNGSRERPVVNQRVHRARSANFLSVGHHALRALEKEFPDLFFDMLFYKQLSIPYEIRYSRCYWERDLEEEERVFKKLVTADKYVFVHDDPSRGYSIKYRDAGMRLVRNDTTESIFHLGLVLERASEVHCMESSIRCMIESLDMRNAKLYYHNFRYPDRPLGGATCQAWETVPYPFKVAA